MTIILERIQKSLIRRWIKIQNLKNIIITSIDNAQKTLYRNGIELEKGVILTQERIEQHRDLYESWCTFFTAYPDLFLDMITADGDNFKLFFYQRIFLRASMRYRYHYCTAPRAFSKTFVSVLALILKCIFLPRNKAFIVAPNKNQAAKNSQEKIAEIFQHWPLLKKEIVGGDISDMPGNYGKDYIKLTFKNGSVLDVVGALDSTRGGRRHCQIFKKNVYLRFIFSKLLDYSVYLLYERRNYMIGYIYHIKCETTGKKYIGITEDIRRRFNHHRSDLRLNKHHSPKLQAAWNYYGEENFTFSYRKVTIQSYEDLYEKEIEEIAKYDSYHNGYNCNSGGKISDWKQKVLTEDIVDFLCLEFTYGDGYGKSFEKLKGWSRGTASAAKRKIRYVNANCIFEKLSAQEKQERGEKVYQETQIETLRLQRQLNQGGCKKAYCLTNEDFFFAFAAQELGYGYSCVAKSIGIQSATVKDWFSGRSRKKERNSYNNLSPKEKEEYTTKVRAANLEQLENLKERQKRLSGGSV